MINILLQSAFMSFKGLTDRPMCSIFWRILLASGLSLILFWFLIKQIFGFYFIQYLSPILGNMPAFLGWLGLLSIISFAFGINHLLYILLCPIITFIGSFYADDIIDIVEQRDFPADSPGRAMTLKESILFGLRFFFLTLIGNILALMLYFVPPIHLLGFYAVNGYIFGRTYFIINALRFDNYNIAHNLFQNNWGLIVSAGIFIAMISAVPLLGIITPLFAPSFMTYIYKNIKNTRLIV